MCYEEAVSALNWLGMRGSCQGIFSAVVLPVFVFVHVDEQVDCPSQGQTKQKQAAGVA